LADLINPERYFANRIGMTARRALKVFALAAVILALIGLTFVIPQLGPGSGVGGPARTAATGAAGLNQSSAEDIDWAFAFERLADSMAMYNLSDPEVQSYTGWLSEALSTKPRLQVLGVSRIFDDSDNWFFPSPSDPVAMGLIRLPFGAAIVLALYRYGDGVAAVVHATVVDVGEWRDLLARIAVAGFGPYHSALLHYEPTQLLPEAVSVWYSEPMKSARIEWTLWRIKLEGAGGVLPFNGSRLPVRAVAVLLEVPAYFYNYTWKTRGGPTVEEVYWWQAEAVYWSLVGHPALSLAIRLSAPTDSDAVELYRSLVAELTRRTVLTGARPGGGVGRGCLTPVQLRMCGEGVCGEYASSTALFASNALGAYAAYVVVRYGSGLHAVSALVVGSGGSLDIDGDGVKEAVVIADTAGLSPEYIEKNVVEVVRFPPLLGVGGRAPGSSELLEYSDNVVHTYILSGAADVLLQLPDWLKAPWLSYTAQMANLSKILDGALEAMKNYSCIAYTVDAVRELFKKFEAFSVRPSGGSAASESNILTMVLLGSPPLPVSSHGEDCSQPPSSNFLDWAMEVYISAGLDPSAVYKKAVGIVVAFVSLSFANCCPLVLRGESVVDGSNVTVVATKEGDCLRLTIYINGSPAEAPPACYRLPASLSLRGSDGRIYEVYLGKWIPVVGENVTLVPQPINLTIPCVHYVRWGSHVRTILTYITARVYNVDFAWDYLGFLRLSVVGSISDLGVHLKITLCSPITEITGADLNVSVHPSELRVNVSTLKNCVVIEISERPVGRLPVQCPQNSADQPSKWPPITVVIRPLDIVIEVQPPSRST